MSVQSKELKATVNASESKEVQEALASLRRRRLRSEEHTSELQSPCNLVCRLLLEKKKKQNSMFSLPHIDPFRGARNRRKALIDGTQTSCSICNAAVEIWVYSQCGRECLCDRHVIVL